MTDTRDDPQPLPGDTVADDEEPAWDEPVSRREARALAGPRRRWPAVLATIAILLVLALLAAGWWVRGQIDPAGAPGDEVVLVIPEGTGTSGIADLLDAEGVITNATLFTAYLKVKGAGDDWLAGRFVFRESSSFDEAIAVLDAGPGEIPFDEVTVPEGFTVFAGAGLPAPGTLVQRLVDRQEGIPRLRQQRIMELLVGGTLRSQYQPPRVGNLEGLLFPDTYRIERDQGAQVLLTAMVQRFDQVATEAGIGEATSRIRQATNGALANISPYEAIIVASLIEREARVPEERPRMARVIYNRLEAGIPLGIDASLNYALGHPATTESELATDSPYNLREVAGLPPTPISVPGRASLEAAVAPEAGEWLYYVLADEEGRHTFTNTYEEFLEAKARCQEAGLC